MFEDRHVLAGIPCKTPKYFVSFECLEFYFSRSEDQYVSLSVTNISLSDIYTHPNVCVFVLSKAGLDEGGQNKAIEFSTYLIKSIFVISLTLGKIQFIMVPSLLQYV